MFGSLLDAFRQEQKALVFVFSCMWHSMPMIDSKPACSSNLSVCKAEEVSEQVDPVQLSLAPLLLHRPLPCPSSLLMEPLERRLPHSICRSSPVLCRTRSLSAVRCTAVRSARGMIARCVAGKWAWVGVRQAYTCRPYGTGELSSAQQSCSQMHVCVGQTRQSLQTRPCVHYCPWLRLALEGGRQEATADCKPNG